MKTSKHATEFIFFSSHSDEDGYVYFILPQREGVLIRNIRRLGVPFRLSALSRN